MPFTSADGPHAFWSTVWNSVPAVYGIGNTDRRITYIGQTDDLKRRMDEHRADAAHCMHTYGAVWVWVQVVMGGEAVRRDRERQLILEYNPACNW